MYNERLLRQSWSYQVHRKGKIAKTLQISPSCQNLSGYGCSAAGSYVRTSVWQNPAQWRPSGEVELTKLTAVRCWNARSSFDPAAGRDVKAASARSLVREDLWRRLRVRRLAWGVPGRRRQREAGAERSWLREVANCWAELSSERKWHSPFRWAVWTSLQVVVSFAVALDAAVGALRSRRTAPAKVTAEERLSEQRLVLVVPYALALVAAVGALRSCRTAPAKVTGKEGLASRELSAKLEISEQRCASQGSGRGRAVCKNLCFEREQWFIKPRIGEPAIDLWLRP